MSGFIKENLKICAPNKRSNGSERHSTQAFNGISQNHETLTEGEFYKIFDFYKKLDKISSIQIN